MSPDTLQRYIGHVERLIAETKDPIERTRLSRILLGLANDLKNRSLGDLLRSLSRRAA